MKRLITIAAAIFVILAAMTVQASADDTLGLDVSYSLLKCGKAVTFSVTADGGSGNYKYLLNSVMRQDEDGWNLVIDPSRMKYVEDSDFPFTFYASGSYTLRFYVMDMSTYKTARKDVTVTINDPNYPSLEEKADTIVKECLKNCSTTYEKALWLHDHIIENMQYDYSYTYCSAEGALSRGTGTCESYHRAYVMLLSRAGLESKRVEGNGHVWTAVKIGSSWYQIDPTWDDDGINGLDSYQSHLYFGLSDKLMQLVHSEHVADSDAPCNSLYNNYFIRSGEVGQWTELYLDEINEKLEAGLKSFSIKTPDSIPAGYRNVICNLVCYDIRDRKLGASKRLYLSTSYDSENDVIKIRTTSFTPTITLSQKSKTLKKGSSFSFTISNIAKGDGISSVKSGDRSLVRVFKTSTYKYKVKGIAKGETYVIVKLKSGKTAKLKVTVN